MPPDADLRSTLEAAIAQEETTSASAAADTSTTPVEPVKNESNTTPSPPLEAGADKPLEPAKSTPEAEKTPKPTEAAETPPDEDDEAAPAEAAPKKPWDINKPPQSWKAPLKAKWSELPADVRSEVMRRERDVTKALGESGQARQFVGSFFNTVRPYEARIRANNLNPLQAVEGMLKTDHVLSSAPQHVRAQVMASMIKGYGIDIAALDSALAGENVPPRQADVVDQIVSQRLKPIEDFVNGQRQQAQLSERQQAQTAQQHMEQMAEDTDNFPHFMDVKEDMADIIELAAKRGVYLSLEQAYSRAVAVTGLDQGNSNTMKDKAAAEANARTQKALNASKSVSGAPSGRPSGAPPGSNMRATIESAFEKVSGR